jgi:hypothetical protein
MYIGIIGYKIHTPPYIYKSRFQLSASSKVWVSEYPKLTCCYIKSAAEAEAGIVAGSYPVDTVYIGYRHEMSAWLYN